eukprot:COSAG02_NODE_679_length_18565_cov_57.795245_10_plen_238_part_00
MWCEQRAYFSTFPFVRHPPQRSTGVCCSSESGKSAPAEQAHRKTDTVSNASSNVHSNAASSAQRLVVVGKPHHQAFFAAMAFLTLSPDILLFFFLAPYIVGSTDALYTGTKINMTMKAASRYMPQVCAIHQHTDTRKCQCYVLPPSAGCCLPALATTHSTHPASAQHHTQRKQPRGPPQGHARLQAGQRRACRRPRGPSGRRQWGSGAAPVGGRRRQRPAMAQPPTAARRIPTLQYG